MEDEPATPSLLKRLPFGLQVRELRTRAGLTQEQLAERTGTTKATISKFERSTNRPKIDWIEKLAAALEVDAEELAFDRGRVGRPVTMMPVIGMIAAGNWREAVRETDEFVPVVDARPHMFVLRVSGDSVDRVAPDGSFVSIDPSDPALVDGKIYAVQNGAGEATLKRFRRNPDRLEPDSSNPEHKPIPLGTEPVTVIGRATSIIRMI
jgi:repressor LexA